VLEDPTEGVNYFNLVKGLKKANWTNFDNSVKDYDDEAY